MRNLKLILTAVATTSLAVAGAANGAGVQPLHRVDLSTPQKLATSRQETAVAVELIHGRYDSALKMAEDGLARAPDDAWLLYGEGVSLAALGRTDDAVAALDRAERSFAPDDVFGRSVTIYHRGLALEDAGRCREASAAFDRYTALVTPFDATMAQGAQQVAGHCVLPSARQPVRGEEPAPPPPRPSHAVPSPEP